MKSFKIVGGDLVIGAHGFEEVEGQAKTLQDISIALREPYGSDLHHPQWGSLLDRFIGNPATAAARHAIQAEVLRIVKQYMAGQQAMIAQDARDQRKSRMTTEEVINKALGVDLAQAQDAFQVKIKLEMLSRGEVSIISTTGA